MKYILTAGWDDGIADLTVRLVRERAEGKKVIWLISGGSNIPATVQIMDNIPTKHTDNLTIMLVDERYGKPGHSQSNWQQLLDAKIEQKHSTHLTILEDGLNEAGTVTKYNSLAKQAFKNNDLVIAQLGIGPDGHIAGLLPGSSSLKAKGALVAGFMSDEEPPKYRLTMTFDSLRKIDAAYCFAFGKPKRVAIKNLQDKLSLDEEPAQILKQIPEAYIYNDQIGHND